MKKTLLFTLCVIVLGFVGGVFFILLKNEIPAKNGDVMQSKETAAEPSEKKNIKNRAFILPHHLVGEPVIKKVLQVALEESPDIIILVSVDHFSRGKYYFNIPQNISTTLAFASELSETVINDFPEYAGYEKNLTQEHGLTVPLGFIEKYKTDAKILPIAISQIVKEKELDELVSSLSRYSKNAIVIASVDFSHFLPASGARLHDAKSLAVLNNLEWSEFQKLEVDSWQSLYLASRFADLYDANKFTLLSRTDSSEILNTHSDSEVTSYVGAYFTLGPKYDSQDTALLAFGDIMLGRNVENKIKKYGGDYVFEKIRQLLWGNDMVLANLEGPMQKNHIQTASGSTRFSFNPSYGKILRKNFFTALTLANNHTVDFGNDSYLETRDILKTFNIQSFGHPKKVSEESTLEFSIRGKNYVFIGLNSVLAPLNEEAALELIRQKEAEEKITVVTLHWGDEYAPQSNEWQKTFAKKMIDSGADIILGHHPHVVQEVDLYKDRLIFYSLGNFIFDQYFSDDTQTGLGVGVHFSQEKTAYFLFPFTIYSSHPELMSGEAKKIFLEKLAQKSSESLQNSIRQGIIKIEKQKVTSNSPALTR